MNSFLHEEEVTNANRDLEHTHTHDAMVSNVSKKTKKKTYVIQQFGIIS